MVHRLLSITLGCCLVFIACHQTRQVSLDLDFSQAPTWRYLFAVDIAGTVKSPDSTRDFSTSLRTYLTGEHAPHDAGAVRFKTSHALITANFLSDEERANLQRQCENQILYLSPKEGAVEAVDTALPALVNIGGWDLFRSFARVLPVLPETPQRVGATWDRERTFPLETSKGNAVGWLYQSFTLDSVVSADSSRSAWVSWRFSYRIEPPKMDSASFLDTLPLQGSGTGVTQIDLTHKRLVKAHAIFEVPAVAKARLKASWRETAHIELVN
jgi:hypothetical protein